MDGKCVVLTGNPADGFTIFGPYDDGTVAAEAADAASLGADWWVLPLAPASELGQPEPLLPASTMAAPAPSRILPKSATVGWSNMNGAGNTVIALFERDGDQFYATAAAALRAFAWQSETPESLGYAKTDVVLEFADGETYTAQLDIKHPSLPDHDTDLSRHVISFVEFHSGRLTDAQLPPRVSRKTYETILRRAPDQVPRHAAFRDRYALSDQEIAATLAALAADKN